MGYFVLALPNILLTIAATLVGLFPQWISYLEGKALLRYSITGFLVIMALATGIISASLMHSSDVDNANLRSAQAAGFSAINQHIQSFEARTPTVPKLDIEFPDEEAQVGKNQVWLNLTLANNGDEVTYVGHSITGIVMTPPVAVQDVMVKQLREHLRKVASQAGSLQTLHHGESRITSAFISPLNGSTIAALNAGAATAFFGFVFDARTNTGLKKLYYYCAIYQGRLVIDCPE